MKPISVVIIAKNEEHILGNTIASIRELTDDIIIGDTGSTDNTIDLAKSLGCRVEKMNMDAGFGITKNNALAFSKYDWILFLDADETVDATLLNEIKNINLTDTKVIYKVAYKNYIGNKHIRFGEWGSFTKKRLFNKTITRWDEGLVHEIIITPNGVTEKKLNGHILHYHLTDLNEYAQKTNRYASMMANKYFQSGKKANWFKLYIYPGFVFMKNYFFKLGILDGRYGFAAAAFSAHYTFLKYQLLKEKTLRAKEQQAG